MKKILNTALIISLALITTNVSLAKKIDINMPDDEIIEQIKNDKAKVLGDKQVIQSVEPVQIIKPEKKQKFNKRN